MADAVKINHAFVSAKIDSTDASIVSSSEWNADEVLSGGQNGQVVLKDATKPSGAKWGQAIASFSGAVSYAGASPSPPLGTTSVVITDHALVLVILTLAATLSAGTTYTVTIRRNGVVQVSYVFAAAAHQTIIAPFLEGTPGTVVFDITAATTTGGATFSALSGNVTALTLPVA